MSPRQQVIDESGAIHTLVRRIGRGGQGEVWLVEGGRRVVKLLHRRRNSESLRRQLAFVRRLDLGGLHVARPTAVLRPPHVGYVAEFLDDMVPIAHLIDAPSSGLAQWHIDGGGLRRRLRLLAHAGEALMGLHARGVVYADVSHHNVFVSEPVHALEAWLIDLDNLAHESDPRRAFFTPGYAAPEVSSAGCTSLSDAWAFAVLVWQALTLTHPFVGDLVDEGEPELQDEAFAGRLPWVGHSEDDSNRASVGLDPALVLGRHLIALAGRTFEDGLRDRQRRPGVSEWVERLHAAADLTVRCAECAGTSFVIEPECPWCDEPRSAVTQVCIARWDPSKGVIRGAVRLGALPLGDEELVLPRRITEGRTGLAAREAHVRMQPAHRGVSVRVMPGYQAWVAPAATALDEQYEVTERGRIVPRDGWVVLFEPPDRPQRVALLGRTR